MVTFGACRTLVVIRFAADKEVGFDVGQDREAELSSNGRVVVAELRNRETVAVLREVDVQVVGERLALMFESPE